MSFTQRFTYAFKRAKTTQIALAKNIGVSQSVISSYLNGDKSPSKEVADKLCIDLNVDYDWLIDDDQSKAPEGWKKFIESEGLSKSELIKKVSELTHDIEKKDIEIKLLKEMVADKNETIADLRKNRNL